MENKAREIVVASYLSKFRRAMQQRKISAFFKPSAPASLRADHLPYRIDAADLLDEKASKISVTYKRRLPDSNPISGDEETHLKVRKNERLNKSTASSSSSGGSDGKVLNKKRSYAQYHLEFGQSDFLLHTCSECGMMYALGDESDEKVHKAYHQDYIYGIQFKGWHEERVVNKPWGSGDRIVLVLDSDPSAHKHKVQQVAKVMEKDLGFGDGQLLHKHCKVYLYILNRRVAGCLIAEPIVTAHRIIPSSTSDAWGTKSLGTCKVTNPDAKRSKPTLQFGSIKFQREVIRKCSSESSKVDELDCGAILCEEETRAAVCGIRAVWVVPSSRRKGLASRLLDAARNSFCKDHILDLSQCAFSSPTSAGKAFASRYCNSLSFLVYMTDRI